MQHYFSVAILCYNIIRGNYAKEGFNRNNL